MRALRVVLSTAAGLALLTGPAHAQAPAPCEERLRTVTVLAERQMSARQATEFETAQTIAGLLRRIEGLQQQVEAAQKPAQEAPKP
jgi:hypothetical protein